MWKHLRISSYIRKPSSSMTLQLLHSEFPYIWGKFDILFYHCSNHRVNIYLGSCVMLHSLAETQQPHIPPHLGSFTRALLVSQDRRHLFVTPCEQRKNCRMGRFAELAIWLERYSRRIRIVTSLEKAPPSSVAIIVFVTSLSLIPPLSLVQK